MARNPPKRASAHVRAADRIETLSQGLCRGRRRGSEREPEGADERVSPSTPRETRSFSVSVVDRRVPEPDRSVCE